MVIDSLATADRAEDLRFVLSVMEEHSHLGLDGEWAAKLRMILLQRIRETEDDGSCCPAAPILFPKKIV